MKKQLSRTPPMSLPKSPPGSTGPRARAAATRQGRSPRQLRGNIAAPGHGLAVPAHPPPRTTD
eukprot:3366140-Alexandrium_andersonii.AAC.1